MGGIAECAEGADLELVLSRVVSGVGKIGADIALETLLPSPDGKLIELKKERFTQAKNEKYHERSQVLADLLMFARVTSYLGTLNLLI